jgi:hypothetical protein
MSTPSNLSENQSAPPASGGRWAGLTRTARAVVVGAVGVGATLAGVAGQTQSPAAPTQQTEDLTVFNGCGPEGTATEGQKIPLAGNPNKNRFDFPEADTLDGSINLKKLLSSKDNAPIIKYDDKGLGDTSVDIEGYVTEVKLGGKESCNCGANDPALIDTHIYVSPAKDSAKNQSIIVEVTPRIRKLMAEQGQDWSTNSLKTTLTGHYVRIGGWLFDDVEHANSSNADGPHPGDWRASCWEIHPVTELDVLPDPPATK